MGLLTEEILYAFSQLLVRFWPFADFTNFIRIGASIRIQP